MKKHLAIALALISTFLVSCSSGSIRTVTQQESTLERVLRTGVIRCGYGIYSPGCLKDPNTGKIAGIGPDTLAKVAAKLGLKVDYVEEVGWGTMLEGLQTGRYDMVVTPVWSQANRAKVAEFSTPLYYSPVMAYGRGNDKRFQHSLNDADSSKITIATIDGATAAVIAQADFPKARLFSLPQMTDFSQLYLTLSSGKADITFTEPASAIEFSRRNPGQITQLAEGRPVRVFPNCWLFKKNEIGFKNMIDTVLEESINDGTIEKIVRAYEPEPNILYRVAPKYVVPRAEKSN